MDVFELKYFTDSSKILNYLFFKVLKNFKTLIPVLDISNYTYTCILLNLVLHFLKSDLLCTWKWKIRNDLEKREKYSSLPECLVGRFCKERRLGFHLAKINLWRQRWSWLGGSNFSFGAYVRCCSEKRIIQLYKDKSQIMRYAVVERLQNIEETGCSSWQFYSITLWVTDDWFMWIGFANDDVLWQVVDNEIRRHSISFLKYDCSLVYFCDY